MGPFDSKDGRIESFTEAWIKEQSPLYADLYVPHSGGSGIVYLIRNVSELRRIISDATPGSVLTIFRRSFVTQGSFNESMKNILQKQISAGVDWLVLSDAYYPEEAEILADGSSWANIESELMEEEPERLMNIFVGKSPVIPNYWSTNSDENVLIIRKIVGQHQPSADR